MHLNRLKSEAILLAREYDEAVACGDTDREGWVGMRQITVDEQIARLERRMARAKARRAKRVEH